MIKFGALKDELKIEVSEHGDWSSKMYSATQSGGPRGYAAQFGDDDERDPWDYDDYRDDDDDDDYLKDEDDIGDDDLDDGDDDFDDDSEDVEEPLIAKREIEALPVQVDEGNEEDEEDE